MNKKNTEIAREHSDGFMGKDLKLQEKNQYISGPVYFRMWQHLFDFKSKQSLASSIIDLFIHYSIMIGLMFLYRWFVSFFWGVQVYILWFIFYLIANTISLSTFARRIRSTGFPWWICFFVYIPLLRCVTFALSLFQEKEEKNEWPMFVVSAKKKLEVKVVNILTLIVVSIAYGPTAIICYLRLDEFLGTIVYDYSTNVNDYEYYLNNVTYANKYLPETIDGFENSKEIMFGYKKNTSSMLSGGFFSEGISLFVNYGSDFYTEKERIENNYEVEASDNWYIGFETFNYKDYAFYIVRNTPNGLSDYVRDDSMCMIGFNDLNKCISYLYFYDIDLRPIIHYKDTEEQRLKEIYDFIEESFVWRNFQ